MIPYLPHLNVFLNILSTTLLICGYAFIRRGRRDLHKRAMISAFVVSSLFVLSYVTYHAAVGSVRFGGEGALRIAYFIILGSHTILAMSVPPMALMTLFRAFGGRFEQHKRLARWTLPIWLYVNITGIVVYLLVYHLNPAK